VTDTYFCAALCMEIVFCDSLPPPPNAYDIFNCILRVCCAFLHRYVDCLSRSALCSVELLISLKSSTCNPGLVTSDVLVDVQSMDCIYKPNLHNMCCCEHVEVRLLFVATFNRYASHVSLCNFLSVPNISFPLYNSLGNYNLC
jgi:hypothetical protein